MLGCGVGEGGVWGKIWGYGGKFREVCWGVEGGKEKCGVCVEVWESVWGEWGSVLGSGGR